MLKEKFESLIGLMELFFLQNGYQKCRKKGEYKKCVTEKMIKMSIVRDRVIRSKSVWEIRIYVSVEYPKVEEMVSVLQGESYKKGNNIFVQDIGLFCGEGTPHAFYLHSESGVERLADVMSTFLIQNVFPMLSDYEDDKKLLHIFENHDISWRYIYFSGGRGSINFYLRWMSLCILNGYINEAFAILENIPKRYGLSKETELVKERMKVLCAGKKQVDSFFLLIDEDVKINPGEEDIRKGLFKLDGLRKYFFILQESSQGNYFQVAGGSGEFIAEIRIYNQEGYNHYRAETRRKEKDLKKIFFGDDYLSIPICQVLSIKQTYEIACNFLATQKLHENYNWIILDL